MQDDDTTKRATALTYAINFHAKTTDYVSPDIALRTAGQFLDFLNGAAAAPTSASAKTLPSTAPVLTATQQKLVSAASGPSSTDSKKAATPSKAKAPAKTEDQIVAEAAAKAEAEAAAEDAAEEVVTRESIGLRVESMLKANKRAEAVGLMKKFGATSVSTLDEKHYAAFAAAADDILFIAG